jgi:hypothetical protein
MLKWTALARLSVSLGELIIGVFVGASVLALGIFVIVSVACIGLL